MGPHGLRHRQLDNSGATAGVCTGKAKPKPVYVGARPRTELILFFNGLIDDVRIYDRALSAAEVWQLYQQGVD